MASSVAGSVTWNLDVDQSKFDAGLAESSAKAKVFSSELDAVDFSSVLKNAGSAFSGIADQIQNVATKVSLFAISGSIGLGTFVKSAADLQQTNQSFQTIIGNTNLANKAIGQLLQYSNNTPFQFKDVSDAGRTLLGFGISAQNLLPNIKQLGDLAGATGGNISDLALVTGQIFAQGTVKAQDFYQIVNSGAGGLGPIMAKVLGVNGIGGLRNAFDQGKVTSDVFFKALNIATSQGGFAFQGASAQAQTFNGRLSTLKDAALEFGRNLLGVKVDPQLGLTVQSGGVFDLLSKQIPIITGDLQKFAPAGTAAFAFIIAHGKDVLAIIAGIAAAFVGAKLAAGIASFSNGLRGLVLGFGELQTKGVAALLATDAAADANPMGVIAIAITGVIGILAALQVKFNIFGKLMQDTKPLIDGVVGAFNGFVDGVKKGDPLITAIAIVIGTVVAAYAALLIVQAAVTIAMGIWTIVTGIATGVTAALGVAVAVVTSPFFLVALAIGGVIAIGYLLITHWRSVVAVADDVWKAISGAVGGAIGAIGNFIGGALNAGANLIGGIVRGIENSAGDVVKAIENICNSALSAVKKFFGIHSPSTVFADLGTNMMAGLANGITAGGSQALDALSSVSDSLLNAVGGTSGGVAVTGSLTASGAAIGAKTVNQSNTYNVSNPIDLTLIAREQNWSAQNAA
jgi:Tape measure protein